MNQLYAFETALFIASMDVQIFDGEEAQMVWADFLAGEGLALEVAR